MAPLLESWRYFYSYTIPLIIIVHTETPHYSIKGWRHPCFEALAKNEDPVKSLKTLECKRFYLACLAEALAKAGTLDRTAFVQG